MKLRAAMIWTGFGVVFSSAVAMAIPVKPAPVLAPPAPEAPIAAESPAPEPLGPSHVSVGRTLLMDARLGHASVAKGSSFETYLFATVTGADLKVAKAPPLDLAIVVDRSGSMKGERMNNALIAAGSAVDRMRDGDSVVIVSFDTQAQVVVPPTMISAATRPIIETAIRSIKLGGDTCISCGLQEARAQLERTPRTGDRAARMLLLSDGATNHGIRDIPGLRGLAGRMRDQGFPITTIGVDVDFDERVMGALATESNGNHYFVSNPSALPAVFAQEFESLASTIARDAQVELELEPGVEVQEVFERSFRREGNRLVVPLGSFGPRDERSILVKLRVPTDREGTSAVSRMNVTYRDLQARSDASYAGTLSLDVRTDGSEQRDMDPFVRARVERSTTARTLSDANELMNQGRFEEARAKLAGRSADLHQAQTATNKAPKTAPAPARARSFDRDFEDQQAALDKANSAANAAASAAPDSRPRKEAAKKLESEMLSNPFR